MKHPTVLQKHSDTAFRNRAFVIAGRSRLRFGHFLKSPNYTRDKRSFFSFECFKWFHALVYADRALAPRKGREKNKQTWKRPTCVTLAKIISCKKIYNVRGVKPITIDDNVMKPMIML